MNRHKIRGVRTSAKSINIYQIAHIIYRCFAPEAVWDVADIATLLH